MYVQRCRTNTSHAEFKLFFFLIDKRICDHARKFRLSTEYQVASTWICGIPRLIGNLPAD